MNNLNAELRFQIRYKELQRQAEAKSLHAALKPLRKNPSWDQTAAKQAFLLKLALRILS